MAAEFGAAVSGENDLERFDGVIKAGPLHVAVFVEGVKELLELSLIGVITDITAVEHLHGEITPSGLVGLQFIGMELVVQETALTADEVGVEVVRLKAIDDRCAFPDAAVFEFQEGDTGGVVLIGSEDFAFGFGGETGDGLDLIAHAEKERIHGVATSGEQGAATVFFAGVPAELTIPGPDAVVVIDFTVVEGAEQTFVDHGFGGNELTGEAAFKTDAAFDAVGLGGSRDVPHLLEGVGHGLFQNDVLLGIGCSDGLIAVLARIGGDIDDVDAGIGEHFIKVLIGRDGASVFGAQLSAIQGA